MNNSPSLIAWLVSFPWASFVIAYTLTAFTLNLQGGARSVHEKEFMWLAPIAWWLNTIWCFILGGTHSVPQRSMLWLVAPVLLVITAIAIFCLIRAIGRTPSQMPE